MAHSEGLVPGTLYLTVSVPDELQELHMPTTHHSDLMSTNKFLEEINNTFSLLNYKHDNEFDWGIYWHRDVRDGTWYTLRLRPGSGNTPRPRYVLHRHDTQQSPRLFRHVVGLIEVLTIPDVEPEDITAYVDWLAPRAAGQTFRSFTWASSVFLRTRRHVAKVTHMADPKAEGFDVTTLLHEALEFAHHELWYSLAGQLPRPTFVPECILDMREWYDEDHVDLTSESEDIASEEWTSEGSDACFSDSLDNVIIADNEAE